MRSKSIARSFNSLLDSYLDSQAFAYVLLSIYFVTNNMGYRAVLIIGYASFFISLVLLFAPIKRIMRKIAFRIDTLFQGGLFVGSVSVILIDGWIGSLKEENQYFFWMLVSWTGLFIIIHGFRIARRIGVYKFLSFGLALFGLLMVTTGHNTTVYQIIAIIGLALSVPALDELLNEKL